MENPVLPSSCVTPAGTSIEVQNEWEENTHTTHYLLELCVELARKLLAPTFYRSSIFLAQCRSMI